MTAPSARRPLTRVIVRLARNPGFPDGDDRQGYVITAPIDTEGKLDLEMWRAHRAECTVVRFRPGVDRDADGLLTHTGSHWRFHYDEESEGDDESVYRLGDHRLALGDYITIRESDGADRTYCVTEHLPA